MSDTGRAVAVDAAGNVYIAGGFMGTVDFDPGGTAPATLSSQGGMDAFLASYDANGGLRWAKVVASATADAVAYGLAAGPAAVHVTGAVGPALFVSAFPLTGGLPNFGTTWNSDGQVTGWAVASDASANAYVVGSFTGSLGSLVCPGQCGLVAEFAANGVLGWSKSIAPVGKKVSFRSVALDGVKLRIAGFAEATSATEALVQTCTTSGTCSSAETLGPPGGSAWAYGIAAAAGETYLTGGYANLAHLTGNYGLASVGGTDVFLRWAAGSAALAVGIGSPQADLGHAVAVGHGGAYLVAKLGGVTTEFLGPGFLVAGYQGVVPIAGFARSYGGVNDAAFGVALAPNEKALYVVGTFSSATLAMGAHALTCAGCTSDIFLAKIQL